MKYTNEDIEFAIRLLHQREEVGDEKTQAWLSVPGHQALLDELSAIRRILSAKEDGVGSEEELLLRHKKRKAQKRRRILVAWGAAASVAALAVVFSWHFFASTDEALPARQTPQKFVELTLSSGKQLFLDTKSETSESGIPYDSINGLDYRATAIDTNSITDRDSANHEIFNTLRTPGGSTYQLTLADGTKVWVNENTAIHYPVAFRNEERKVRLRGEAYFEVRPDARHPFIVETNGAEVKVYGTEFNVNAYDSTRIQTVLVEGKVGMRIEETGQEVILRPRELAEYDKGEGRISVREVSPYAYIAWKNGEFVFDNTSIEEIMERLAQWYDLHVFYASEEAKRIRFSGILDRNDSILHCLKRMEDTGTVRFEAKGKSVTVYKN